MATKRNGRPHGGARAGAGRPKGSKSRIYKPHVEKLMAARPGMLPKDVTLQVMGQHFEARRFDEAARIAAWAASYVHPRLSCSTVAVHRSIAQQMQAMSDGELAACVKELEEMAGISDADELATVRPKGSA
jgi:hypothetical protein